ncbi:MAG: hypothetical protein AAGJ92_01560 [Pseudomonadota bacterium]
MIALQRSWEFLRFVSSFLATVLAVDIGSRGGVVDERLLRTQFAAPEVILGLRVTYLDQALESLHDGRFASPYHPFRYRAILETMFRRSLPSNQLNTDLCALSVAIMFDVTSMVGASGHQLCEFIDGLEEIVRNQLLVPEEVLSEHALVALFVFRICEAETDSFRQKELRRALGHRLGLIDMLLGPGRTNVHHLVILREDMVIAHPGVDVSQFKRERVKADLRASGIQLGRGESVSELRLCRSL